MHIGSLIVAALACITGLTAACLWWQASRIVANPVWVAEPGEAMASLQGWVFAMLEASSPASRKNARAAIWTGVSVGLSTVFDPLNMDGLDTPLIRPTVPENRRN